MSAESDVLDDAIRAARNRSDSTSRLLSDLRHQLKGELETLALLESVRSAK